MKKLLLCLSILINIIFSQDSNAVNDLQYYPLQTGNYFEYLDHNYEYPYYSEFTAHSITILGDTALENGFTYKILLTKDIPAKNSVGSYEFQRIDSSDGSVYVYQEDSSLMNNERKIDSLYAQMGGSILCSRSGMFSGDRPLTICADVRTDTVLGIEANIKEFNDDSGIPSLNYELAEGFGLISTSLCEFNCGSSRLVYAEINGDKYGEHVSLGDLSKYQEQIDYYPLNTGDYFEYYFEDAIVGEYYNLTAYSITILGDTTLENNKTYKILLDKSIPGYGSSGKYIFQRVDSSDGSVYQYFDGLSIKKEYKIDSLFAEPGDYFKASREGNTNDSLYSTLCTGKEIDTQLGLETEVKDFEDLTNSGFYYMYSSLAKGLGLILYSNHNHYSKWLVYAEVKGKKYGNPVELTRLRPANGDEFRFYPLDKDDYFEFRTISNQLNGQPDTSAYSIEVIGSATPFNGKTYKKLLKKMINSNSPDSYIYERIDSSDGSIYRYKIGENYEYKIDSLYTRISDTIKCSRTGYGAFNDFSTICTEVRVDTILGVSTVIKKFEDHSGDTIKHYELARDFGVISNFSYDGEYSQLVYAEINGQKYGNPFTDVEEIDSVIPKNFNVSQNYPNPFNPVTNINFDIPQRTMVDITVYDITGARVKTLTKKEYLPGSYKLKFDGTNLSSGVYFYRLKTSFNVITRKMLLLK